MRPAFSRYVFETDVSVVREGACRRRAVRAATCATVTGCAAAAGGDPPPRKPMICGVPTQVKMPSLPGGQLAGPPLTMPMRTGDVPVVTSALPLSPSQIAPPGALTHSAAVTDWSTGAAT